MNIIICSVYLWAAFILLNITLRRGVYLRAAVNQVNIIVQKNFTSTTFEYCFCLLISKLVLF